MPPSTNPPTLPPSYTLHTGYPSIATYRHLRNSAGLSRVSESQAENALRGSWFGCYITHDQSDGSPDTGVPVVVAMGRILGGGWYFHIADMATLPEYQRRGFGDVVLKTLLGRIEMEKEKSDGGVQFVSLFADPPGKRLYEKNGFEDAAPEGWGMVLKG